MADCPKHGPYCEDHGCGTAHFYGSSSAEHMMNCPKSSMNYGQTPLGGFFRPNDGTRYPPWEAPAGNCPACWHEAHPDAKVLEFSAFGRAAKEGSIKAGLLPRDYEVD